MVISVPFLWIGSETMFKDEGYKLMSAAFEVYNQMGYGMAEEVYQQSLEIELTLRGIPFQSKRELMVFYKDRALVFCFNGYGTNVFKVKRQLPRLLMAT